MTIAPTARDASTMVFTGLIVPRLFDTSEIDTILVRSVMSDSRPSRTRRPSSSISMYFNVAPVLAASSCHGTMFEWCSMTEIRISSPSPTWSRPHAVATRLIASVVPRVQIHSAALGALIQLATFSRAASNATVARLDSSWMPR